MGRILKAGPWHFSFPIVLCGPAVFLPGPFAVAQLSPLWPNASPPGLLHPHDSSRDRAERPHRRLPCAIAHRTSHQPRLYPRAPTLDKDYFVSCAHCHHPYLFVKGLEPNKNGKKPRIKSVSNSQETLEESFNSVGDQHRDISPPAPDS
jgi:hypothetical protein